MAYWAKVNSVRSEKENEAKNWGDIWDNVRFQKKTRLVAKTDYYLGISWKMKFINSEFLKINLNLIYSDKDK